MALFKKRLSLNEILKAISALSPEDKEKVRAAAESEAPAEEAPAEDAAKAEEETPAANTEAVSDGGESIEEVAKDSDEEPQDTEGTESTDPTTEASSESVEADAEEARDETVQDEEADDHSAEIIKALTDRVIALEDGMKTLKALQDRMEEYDARNAEKFGYHGKPGDKRQDISEMSASELKEKILSGQH